MLTTVAVMMLENAGYKVEGTDIPGLFNVPGIGSDLTTGQLCDVAQRHGSYFAPPRWPKMNFMP